MRLLAAVRLVGSNVAGVVVAGLGVTAAGYWVAHTGGTASTTKPVKVRPMVLCGPSGAGKSTLITKLQTEFPNDFGFSVSHTTRAPRPGEKDGVHYHFVDRATMERMVAEGQFLEVAHVYGNMYGTSRAAVEDVASTGKICILDIDIQGVKTCRKVKFDVGLYVFLAPPSLEILEARLRGRGTETEEKVKLRVAAARAELEEAKTMAWDAMIVNDKLDESYARIKALTAPLRAEVEAHGRERKASAAAGGGGKA